ncbi:LysR family transcriptional regulator [Actinosynnema sp. CS-041913]|uniref:LysR family transcriptional regulator n=1 Tax=Actinosynnema sp. CS-041913 TaxID=3239917 RepID=UPI003D8C31ED
MDLEGLRSFLAVARHRTISKAAASLHVTQPTMSLRLRRLEDGLGFPLFERGWRGVTLTRRGAYFLPYAAQLVRDLAGASAVLGEPGHGRPLSFATVARGRADQLVVGVDPWLTGRLTDAVVDTFHAATGPAGFRISSRPAPTLIDLLELGHLDYAVYYSTGRGDVSHARPLLRDRMVLVHHSDLVLEGESAVREALANHDFLLFDNPVLTHHADVTTRLIDHYGLTRFRVVDDLDVMLSLLRKGDTISILPVSALPPDSRSAKVSITELGRFPPEITIDLGWHAGSGRAAESGAFHAAISAAVGAAVGTAVGTAIGQQTPNGSPTPGS